MKKILSWKNLVFILLIGVGILGGIALSHPSTAKTISYQQMIELQIIDEVRSPKDLGLDYLHRRPPQLTASLIDNMRFARGKYQETDNIALAIPLGDQSPVASGQLQSDNGVPPQIQGRDVEAIATVDPTGRPEGIVPRDAASMITEEERNGGTLDNVISRLSDREILVADASNLLTQTRRIRVIDLIVRDKRTNRIYLLPDVRADSFCRDVINAGVKRTFRPNQVNLRTISRSLPRI